VENGKPIIPQTSQPQFSSSPLVCEIVGTIDTHVCFFSLTSFYRLLWHVSNYALRCTLEREHSHLTTTIPYIAFSNIDHLPLDQHLSHAQNHALKVSHKLRETKLIPDNEIVRFTLIDCLL
jgi:hypothetical protein